MDPDGRVIRRRQCLSIVTFPNRLRLAMAFDEQGSWSIVAGSDHRWTRFMWRTTYIDWSYHQSIVADKIFDNRWIFPLVFCRRQYLSMNYLLVHCRRQHSSMETFHSLLPPTKSIYRFVLCPLSTSMRSIHLSLVRCRRHVSIDFSLRLLPKQ